MQKVFSPFAYLFSIIAHPLLMVSYAMVFLLLINPFMFGVYNVKEFVPILLIVFSTTFLIPSIALFMMRALGLVNSISLSDKKERIGPLIVAMILYSWLLINFYHHPSIPPLFVFFLAGATISLAISFMFTVFMKISIHGVGIGGMLGGLIALWNMPMYRIITILTPSENSYTVHFLGVIMTAILIAGIVGTSRLYLKAHNLTEWTVGIIVGLFSMFLSYEIIL